MKSLLVLIYIFMTTSAFAQFVNEDESCHEAPFTAPSAVMSDHTHVEPFKMAGVRYGYTHNEMNMYMLEWMQGLSKRLSYMVMVGLHQPFEGTTQVGDINLSLSWSLLKLPTWNQHFFISMGTILPSSVFGTAIEEHQHLSVISMQSMHPSNRFAILPRFTYLGNHLKAYWGVQASYLMGVYSSHHHEEESEEHVHTETAHIHSIMGNVDQLAVQTWFGHQWHAGFSTSIRFAFQRLLNPMLLHQDANDHLPNDLIESGLGMQFLPEQLWGILPKHSVSLEFVLPWRSPNELHDGLADNLSKFNAWSIFSNWQYKF